MPLGHLVKPKLHVSGPQIAFEPGDNTGDVAKSLVPKLVRLYLLELIAFLDWVRTCLFECINSFLRMLDVKPRPLLKGLLGFEDVKHRSNCSKGDSPQNCSNRGAYNRQYKLPAVGPGGFDGS